MTWIMITFNGKTKVIEVLRPSEGNVVVGNGD